MLSIVIATHDSEHALVPTLAALVAGAAAGALSEVIIADGGSTDATAEIGDIAGCQVLVSRAPLGARLKAAAATGRAPWLMFLRPGIVLDRSWTEEAARFVETMDAEAMPRAAVFRPAPPDGAERPMLMEALMLLRAALGGRPGPDQGLLIAKRRYDALGGHRPEVADPEADLLRRLGRRIVMLRAGAVKVAVD